MSHFIPYSVSLNGSTSFSTRFSLYSGGFRREGPFNDGHVEELKKISATGFYRVSYLSDAICCPYCKSNLNYDNYKQDLSRMSVLEHNFVESIRCHTCGWWFIRKQQLLDDDIQNVLEESADYWEGAIAKFSSVPRQFVLKHVASELADFRKSLASVSPREFEKLVGVFLGDSYKCDVHHVGRASSDGGIDLLLLLGDETMAVQVKHRQLQRRQISEGVRELRELVGAIFINTSITQGMFVTSAPSFSNSAVDYSLSVRERMPINLVSASDLKAMLRLMQVHQWDVYEQIWNTLKPSH